MECDGLCDPQHLLQAFHHTIETLRRASPLLLLQVPRTPSRFARSSHLSPLTSHPLPELHYFPAAGLLVRAAI